MTNELTQRLKRLHELLDGLLGMGLEPEDDAVVLEAKELLVFSPPATTAIRDKAHGLLTLATGAGGDSDDKHHARNFGRLAAGLEWACETIIAMSPPVDLNASPFSPQGGAAEKEAFLSQEMEDWGRAKDAEHRAFLEPIPKTPQGTWTLYSPQGDVVATETSCIRAWARIQGYKPTVEGLLAFEEKGWRVASQGAPAAEQPTDTGEEQ